MAAATAPTLTGTLAPPPRSHHHTSLSLHSTRPHSPHKLLSPLCLSTLRHTLRSPLKPISASSTNTAASAATFHGPCYVLGDNIDTDQIIPAEYLTLVPSKPDEYRKLGTLALVGLPSALYSIPFIDAGADTTKYPIIIAGWNFGCGSSREHAPVALGASGVRAVVAGSFARIFFRNSVATGEVYPIEADNGELYKDCTTGDILTVDIGGSKLINHTTGKVYELKPIGDAGPVIEAGGIFAYARKMGMISA